MKTFIKQMSKTTHRGIIAVTGLVLEISLTNFGRETMHSSLSFQNFTQLLYANSGVIIKKTAE